MENWTVWAVWALIFINILLSFATGAPPSVEYIKSSIHGNFFIAKGKNLKKQFVSITIGAPCYRDCLDLCFRYPGCKAVSSQPFGSAFYCHLSSLSPLDSELLNNTGATYFFTQDSISGDYSEKNDGLLYLYMGDALRLPHPEAKDLCNRIPGHRLVITKTIEQWDNAYSYVDDLFSTSYLVMDLVKQADGSLKWGDGTPFEDTEIGTEKQLIEDHNGLYYIFRFGKINDIVSATKARVLCQANPLGVDW